MLLVKRQLGTLIPCSTHKGNNDIYLLWPMVPKINLIIKIIKQTSLLHDYWTVYQSAISHRMFTKALLALWILWDTRV